MEKAANVITALIIACVCGNVITGILYYTQDQTATVPGDTTVIIVPGEDGPSGFNGTKGPDGEKGDTGPQGPPGANGTRGSQGIAGANGTAGIPGAQGPKGPSGSPGPAGGTLVPQQGGYVQTSTGTLTGNTWNIRGMLINGSDTGNGVLVTGPVSNVYTFVQGGTYYVKGHMVASRVTTHQSRLFDITNNVVLAWGITSRTQTGQDSVTEFSRVFNVTAGVQFRIEHGVQLTRASTGQGQIIPTISGLSVRAYGHFRFIRLS